MSELYRTGDGAQGDADNAKLKENKRNGDRRAIERSELPLHCPLPSDSLWNSHPRVYIPIQEAVDGQAKCPYCGTEFYLVES